MVVIENKWAFEDKELGYVELLWLVKKGEDVLLNSIQLYPGVGEIRS